jgi:hypothetical protein
MVALFQYADAPFQRAIVAAYSGSPETSRPITSERAAGMQRSTPLFRREDDKKTLRAVDRHPGVKRVPIHEARWQIDFRRAVPPHIRAFTSLAFRRQPQT